MHLPACQLNGTQLKQEKEIPFCVVKIPTTLIIFSFQAVTLNGCTVPTSTGFFFFFFPHKMFIYLLGHSLCKTHRQMGTSYSANEETEARKAFRF